MQRIPMTTAGAAKLREELEHLKHEERPRVIQAISSARAHGDLKENAEYHAAKEQQSFIEGRIREIESKLSNAQVIDVTTLPQRNKVVFGSTVTFVNLDTDEVFTYQIVGLDEADIKNKKISFDSPLARAAIGKGPEDIIEVKTPKGPVEHEIQEIAYI